MRQTEYKRIGSIRLQKEIIDKHYQSAIEARGKGIPVIWTSANFPVEIIYAMDMIPVYPENLAVMVQVKGGLLELSEIAERKGYTCDICSYARCNIGSVESGISPIGPLPPPDALCVNTVQCFQIMKWFEVLSRQFKVPYYVLDSGFVAGHQWDEIEYEKWGKSKGRRPATLYFKRQLEELIALLEKIGNRKMDYDHLREVLRTANRTYQLWFEIMESAANIPSPISLFDLYVAMSLVFNMRGTQEALDYYEKVKSEIDERVKQKIPAVPGERLRLHYENMPLWYSFRKDRDFFSSYGVNVLTNLYLYMFVNHYPDVSDPLEALSTEYERASLNIWGEVARAKFISELIERFSLDGFILHNVRTCKNSSGGLWHIAKLVTKKTGIPGLVFDADHGDPRFYNEEYVRGLWKQYFEVIKK